MSRRAFILTLLMVFLSQCSVTGQGFHTRSNRALRLYDTGKRDYDLLYYDRAEQNLRLAAEEDDGFYEAHLLLGQLYSDTGQWEKSVKHYRRAIELDSLYFPPALYSLGRAEMRIGEYSEAKRHLEAYLNQPKTTSRLRIDAEKLVADCLFALSFPGSLFKVEPVSAGDSVNSALD